MRLRRVALASEAADESAAPAPGKRARTEAVQRAGGGSGAPLDGGVRARFEGSLGVDLGGVRVHTGAESAAAAEAVSAKAYTVGNDIHFGAGQYAPDDPYGLHLLAHEVAHTVQQDGGAPTAQFKLDLSAPGDACEVEADSAADAMVAGHWFQIGTSAGGLMRTPADAAPTDGEKQQYAQDKVFAEGLMRSGESLQGAMLAHHHKEMAAVGAIAKAGGVLVRTYDEAHARHEQVIAAANEAEELKQGILDFVLNIVVGAATGGLASVFVPTASAAFSVGRALTEELISQTASTAASASILDIKNNVTALARENKDAERWEMVAELFREAADLVPTLGKLARFTQASTKIVGDANAIAAGAPLAFFGSRAELDAAIAALRGGDIAPAFQQMRAAIDQGWRALDFKRAQIELRANDPQPMEMERLIWLKWISQARGDEVLGTHGPDTEYEALDNDTVEKRLAVLGVTGARGALRHDNGSYTGADDERIMRASAKEKLQVLQLVGKLGRVSFWDGAWRLRSPHADVEAPCEPPPGERAGGWFKATDAVSRDELDEHGEKRVRWRAALVPATDDELADHGIDASWTHRPARRESHPPREEPPRLFEPLAPMPEKPEPPRDPNACPPHL